MKVVMLTTDARECWREYDNPAPYFGPAPEALLQIVPAFPTVEMHVISCWQKPMAAPAKLADNVWFHGLLVPKLGWGRTGFQGCIRACRKKIQELKPDIVHGQGTERDCAISAVLSGCPNVVTIHGNMDALAKLSKAGIGTYPWVIARLENFTLKRAGGVFCNSAYTEALVKPRTRRTWRVANAIRAEFLSDVEPPPSSQRCVLINVGVISERKRQLELVKLAGDLHARGLVFEFQFVGKADPQSTYGRAFLDRMRVAEKAGYARYLGLKSSQELIECFDGAHGMVHFPSEEAFGLVVAEALARNLKFFGSNTGGILEIASNVDGAELFALEDWAGLGNSIERWIRTGFPRAESAAETIRERYHPRVIMRQHIAIYEEVLSSCS